jgi:UDP-glucose 4-epimerase
LASHDASVEQCASPHPQTKEKTMRIAVTSGTSFIGSHLAEGLLACGHEVLVLDEPGCAAGHNVPSGATSVSLDLCASGELARVLQDFRASAVCHQGQAGGAVLDASLRSGVQSLLLGVPCREREHEGTCQHREHAHRSHARLRKVTLRYGNVYGPRQDPWREPGVVGAFISRMLRNEPIQINARSRRGDDGCERDYVFVGDVVRATLAALDPCFGHDTIDVGTGRSTTTRALAERIRGLCGSRSSICYASPRPGDRARVQLDPTPLRALYQPTSLSAGLAKTIAWFDARVRRSEPVSERIPRPEGLTRALRIVPGTAA